MGESAPHDQSDSLGFVVPHEAGRTELSDAEKHIAATRFTGLVDTLCLNHIEDIDHFDSFEGLPPRDVLALTRTDEAGVQWNTKITITDRTSEEQNSVGIFSRPSEKLAASLTVSRVDEQGESQDLYRYGLGLDGVVRRRDLKDYDDAERAVKTHEKSPEDTPEAPVPKEERRPMDVLSMIKRFKEEQRKRSPEERRRITEGLSFGRNPFMSAEEQWTQRIEREKEKQRVEGLRKAAAEDMAALIAMVTARNNARLEEDMGINNQPVSEQEIDGLVQFMDSPGYVATSEY